MYLIPKETDAEYFLYRDLMPPGKASIFEPRHDQSIAGWSATDRSVQLLKLWKLERPSGQKYHFWPIFSQGRVQAFLGELLSEMDLTLANFGKFWGLPNFSQSDKSLQQSEVRGFPVRSLSHLFSGLLLDTGISIGRQLLLLQRKAPRVFRLALKARATGMPAVRTFCLESVFGWAWLVAGRSCGTWTQSWWSTSY